MYPLGFCRFRERNLGKASSGFRPPRANRGFSPYPRDTKNTPQWGVLVYPLGLEPKLDGVGGRNVIQLHYEYAFASFRKQYYFTIFSPLFQAFHARYSSIFKKLSCFFRQIPTNPFKPLSSCEFSWVWASSRLRSSFHILRKRRR